LFNLLSDIVKLQISLQAWHISANEDCCEKRTFLLLLKLCNQCLKYQPVMDLCYVYPASESFKLKLLLFHVQEIY